MRSKIKYYFLLCLIFILIGIIYTYPMIRHFRSGIPYTRYGIPGAQVQHAVQGDHLQLYYRFWLFKDMFKGNSGLFESKYEFNTAESKSFRIGSYFMPYPLIFALFDWLGRGAGYNLIIIASYLFSGISMYLLVFLYTKDRFASVLAGIIFSAAPYRTMSVLSGHPTGLSIFYIPLFIFFLEKVLQTKSLKYAIWGGLTFLFLADNDLHTLYLTGLISPLFVLKHFAFTGWKNAVKEIKPLILPAIILAVFCAGALTIKLSRTSLTGTEMERTASEVYAYSPGTENIFERNNDKQSRYAYLGITVCLFTGIIFVLNLIKSIRTKSDKKEILQMAFFLTLLLVFYLLVFGSRTRASGLFNLLREYLPKFGMIRQTVKMMVISIFALSVAAGIGFAFLKRIASNRTGLIISLAIISICLLDFSPLPTRGAGISILPTGNKAYEDVFSNKPEARVVCVPIWPGNDAWASHYQYFSTIYHTIMINGYSAVPPKNYMSQIFQPLKSLNAGQLSKIQYDLLRKMKVEYVIMHEQAFPPKVSLFPSYFTLDNFAKSPFLELASEDTPITIFNILDENNIKDIPIPIGTSVAGIVHEAETFQGGSIIEDDHASNNKSLLFGKEVEYSTIIRRRATPAGNYVFSARVKSDGKSNLIVSVMHADENVSISSKSFDVNTNNEYDIISMDFTLEEFISVYYLIEKKGSGEIAIDWFHIKFSDQNDPVEIFEFDEIYHTGNVKEHAGASQGKAVFLTNTDPRGKATRGPYRLLQKGEYEIVISMSVVKKATIRDDDIVASLILRNSMDEKEKDRDIPYNILLSEQIIRARDFADDAGFSSFKYRFKLDRPQFISVNINHFGYDIYLDKAEIRRIAD